MEYSFLHLKISIHLITDVSIATHCNLMLIGNSKSLHVKKFHNKMGCLCTRDIERESEIETSNKKIYSWDLKRANDFERKKYVIEHLNNEERIEVPETVNGEQFLIQNCETSMIYILDHMNTVSVYDCVNCTIVLGPVKGSLYIGGCQNCIFVIACGQLRIRDSRRILAFVHCETQPVIEASSSILFGTYQLKYKQIKEHFRSANLNNNRKNWKVVHDFTPLPCETNWKFIENDNVCEYIKDPLSSDVNEKLRLYEHKWCRTDEVTQNILVDEKSAENETLS